VDREEGNNGEDVSNSAQHSYSGVVEDTASSNSTPGSVTPAGSPLGESKNLQDTTPNIVAHSEFLRLLPEPIGSPSRQNSVLASVLNDSTRETNGTERAENGQTAEGGDKIEDGHQAKEEKFEDGQKVKDDDKVVETKKVEDGNQIEDGEQVKKEKIEGRESRRKKTRRAQSWTKKPRMAKKKVVVTRMIVAKKETNLNLRMTKLTGQIQTVSFIRVCSMRNPRKPMAIRRPGASGCDRNEKRARKISILIY
jgi:hypothetical protein